MLNSIKNLITFFGKEKFNSFLLLFCIFLPFQFALNPIKGIDLAVARIIIPLFFLSWIAISIKKNEKLLKGSLGTYLLLFFIFLVVISSFYSANFSWSLRKLFFLFSLGPIYFILVSAFKSEKLMHRILMSLTFGAAALSLIAILQFISQFIFSINSVYSFLTSNVTPFFLGQSFSQAVTTYPSWLVNSGGTTYMRAFAMFPDPHMLSYYLEIILPFSIAFMLLAKNRKWPLISVCLILIADVLTFTRGSYLAIILGSLIIIPLVSKSTIKKIILGASFFALLFASAPHNPVTQRLSSSFDMQEGSNQGRLSNWQQAFSVISNNPFGVGIGSYSLAIKPTAEYREPIYAHNLYLDIAAETGIITAIIFIGILINAFRNFWQAAKSQPFFIAGVSSMAIFSIHSLVENPLYSVHVLPLFLIILALSETTNSYEKKSIK
jgi:O-antigen ligase